MVPEPVTLKVAAKKDFEQEPLAKERVANLKRALTGSMELVGDDALLRLRPGAFARLTFHQRQWRLVALEETDAKP